jgi:F0F1-type ATP synthase assembly protein I
MATATGKSTKQLLGDLFAGLRGLARDHVQEIKHERQEEREARARAPVQFGVAIGVTLVGAVLVGQALAYGLGALGVPTWLAYAVIGAIVLGVGISLLKKLPSTSEMDTVPETAIKRIGHDIKEIANEVVNDVRHAGEPQRLQLRPDVTTTE